MNNKFLALTGILILAACFIAAIQSNPKNEIQANEIVVEQKYVFEVFQVYAIEDGDVYANVIQSYSGEDGGLFLVQEEFEQTFEIGDYVLVTYDAEEYLNGNYDSMINVQIIEGLNWSSFLF